MEENYAKLFSSKPAVASKESFGSLKNNLNHLLKFVLNEKEIFRPPFRTP